MVDPDLPSNPAEGRVFQFVAGSFMGQQVEADDFVFQARYDSDS